MTINPKFMKGEQSKPVDVLYSATTTGKLLTTWPEIKPVINKFVKTDEIRTNLPAKVLVNLNESLGLKKAAA